MDEFELVTIEMVTPGVRRRSLVDDRVIGRGESGVVAGPIAEALVERGDAQWAGESRCAEETAAGDQCSRRSRESGYCYQHEPDGGD
mgnify:CR=1 FL=1